MNQQAYRFMFSPSSKIMTVHNIILNPFSLAENRVRRDGNVQPTSVFPSGNGGVNQQEYITFLRELTNTDQKDFYELEEAEQARDKNKVTIHDQPIFLHRNLQKMQACRKSQKVRKSQGLVTYVIPLLQQLQFQSQTEDTIVISRKTSVLGKRKIMNQDLEVNQKMRDVVAKRLKLIDIGEE